MGRKKQISALAVLTPFFVVLSNHARLGAFRYRESNVFVGSNLRGTFGSAFGAQ
jgi:hypothetical protein